MDIHRYAADVVGYLDGLIRVDGDHHPVTMTRQCLVDGVVHHLENHVMQATAVVGVADVHSGAFADCVESL